MTADDNDTHHPHEHDPTALAVGVRVRVHSGHDADATGTIVEDFGEAVGIPVYVGTTHIVDPARRWAITLDDGGLTFLDSEHLTTE